MYASQFVLPTRYYSSDQIKKNEMGGAFLTFIGPCIVIYFYSKTNQMHQCIKLFCFGMTPCMFRTVFPSIIRSSRLYIQQQAYVKQILLSVCERVWDGHFWHMPVAVCTVLNSWWWTERPSEIYRVSFQNKIIWYIGVSGRFYCRNGRGM